MTPVTRKIKNKSVLVVSADRSFESTLGLDLGESPYEFVRAHTRSEALNLFNARPMDLVLLDIENMPVEELDLVNFIKNASPDTEIVILATVKELDEARNTLRNGASFYLVKPVAPADIRQVLDKIAGRAVQEAEHRELEQQFLQGLMAGNTAMEKVLKLAIKIAPTTSTVLIGGESGTGKEFFARIIHRMSRRPPDTFVAANCGAIPDTLFESEFFGHRKGAFTGADRDKPGMVEEAHMGTLFLDEVGELSPSAQVKLLRFVQDRTFRRVGDSGQRTVNVRVIAATNRDLWEMVKAGTFREDLFYRLNVFYLNLPPLRSRRETIPSLVRLFVHRYNNLLEKDINSFSKTAEVLLANYDYPGNVRELENIIEHAVVLADNGEITERDLPEFMFRNRLLLNGPQHGGSACSDEICTLESLEKNHITYALQKTAFNFSDTARKLGISRSTLWRKTKGYGILTPGADNEPPEDEHEA